eukprot:3860349-Amphidinium_carterae.1
MQQPQAASPQPPPATALPLHPDLVHEPPPTQLCELLLGHLQSGPELVYAGKRFRHFRDGGGLTCLHYRPGRRRPCQLLGQPQRGVRIQLHSHDHCAVLAISRHFRSSGFSISVHKLLNGSTSPRMSDPMDNLSISNYYTLWLAMSMT